MKLQCKVVVIGGGPAGAIAARELAIKGIDHILLEKNLLFNKPCGGGLKLSAFEEFDLSYHMIEKVVNKIEMVSPSGRKVSVDITQSPLAIVDRKEFDISLRQIAQKYGTKVIEGKVEDIFVGTKVKVFAKNKEETIEIDSEYVIAADGVHSVVRKKVCYENPKRVLTHYVNINEKETNMCQFWFGQDIAPGYYAWVFPHHHGVNIGTISRKGKYSGEQIEYFLTQMDIKKNYRIKGYYIPDWGEEIFYEKNIFFIGDSASLVLPFTYEGIYYAMQSAVLAVSAIVEDEPARYEREWRRLNEKKFRFLHLLQRIFLSKNFMSEQLVALYCYPHFQKAVIGYWIGTKKPVGILRTLWKVVKVLVVGGFLSLYKRQFGSQSDKDASSDLVQPGIGFGRVRKPTTDPPCK